MKTTTPLKPKRRTRRKGTTVARTAGASTSIAGAADEPMETIARRAHGDSYSDIQREDDLVANSSTHTPPPDRGREEPAETVIGEPERLEGSL